MQNKKLVVGSALAVAFVLAGAYSFSSAYRGDAAQPGPNYTPERHESMEQAFENKDYAAWKNLMQENTRRGRVMDVVNEENFSKFAEAHELMEQGKIEEANQIREDLGLGLGHGKGQGRGMHRGYNSENRGQNLGGNFVDENGNEICDMME